MRRWLAIVYITLERLKKPEYRWFSSVAETPFQAHGDHELMALGRIVDETLADERSGKVALERVLEQPRLSLGDDPRLWGASATGLASAHPVPSLMIPLQQIVLLVLAISRGQRKLTLRRV